MDENLKYRSLFTALNLFPYLKEYPIDRSEDDDAWVIRAPSMNEDGFKYETIFRIYDDPFSSGKVLEMTIFNEII